LFKCGMAYFIFLDIDTEEIERSGGVVRPCFTS
jgi:hypothetical protein